MEKKLKYSYIKLFKYNNIKSIKKIIFLSKKKKLTNANFFKSLLNFANLT